MEGLKEWVRRVPRRSAGAFIVCCVYAALAGPASAQEARGTITGTVRDATKGVIPGATVTITNTWRWARACRS